MGQYSTRKPLQDSRGKPYGPRWTQFAKLLKAGWWRSGRVCFYCFHAFTGPDGMEACHLVSPILAPSLAWSPDNIVPGHGSGKRRCTTPECQLNCNWLQAVSPLARKNAAGEDLPFSPEMLAHQAAESARFRAKRAGRAPFPGNVRRDTIARGPGSVTPGTPREDPGRDW